MIFISQHHSHFKLLFDFKCIIEEADLMCNWLLLRIEDCDFMYYVRLSNEIRLCVLSFVLFKGFEHSLIMATMMVHVMPLLISCTHL
jgi:hypothetical protein